MTGIISYGAYIPYWRLRADTAAQAFGKKGGRGQKAVAYCDEDSVTMAVAAALDAAAGREKDKIKGVFFASTTASGLPSLPKST